MEVGWLDKKWMDGSMNNTDGWMGGLIRNEMKEILYLYMDECMHDLI